jgi:hypothetical protein
MELQKALLLLIPSAAWVLLFVSRKYTVREYSGAFLAYVWQFQTSLILNIILVANGFWNFETQNHLLYGIPVDVLMGQAVLLGAVNFLIFRKIALGLKLAGAVPVLCCIFAYSAIVVPQPLWWLGIIVLAIVSIIPSLLVAEWTTDDRHVGMRSTLQTLSWVCLLLWLFPSAIFAHTNHSWEPLLTRPFWQNALYALPLVIPAMMLLSALRQFAVEGGGTAFPYDPPKTLVTKGVYAYLSNPMQLGICLLMAWWGVITESAWVSLSAVVAVFLFIVFKDICNGSCAIGEQDPNWAIYQKEVPKWIPRLKPWKLN